METLDLLVIGAGPAGLSAAIEAQKLGWKTAVIDKGCLVNSIYEYPVDMVFFTTPELLELGGIPFPSAHQKPVRQEVLEYYRKLASYFALDLRLYQTIESIAGSDGAFRVSSRDRAGRSHEYAVRKLVLAMGYYDQPNLLGIPGEELPKVTHYYKDAHPCYGCDVAVIGGKNSAVLAALDLWRHGARVTLIHRRAAVGEHVKYWIRPDIENRIKAGEIKAYFNSTLRLITPGEIEIETPQGAITLANDAVFAMTGYKPKFDFYEKLGIGFHGDDHRPEVNPETLESNVKGIYLAGVIVGGRQTNEIFIENGREHGEKIAAGLGRK